MGRHSHPATRTGRHRLERSDRVHCRQFNAVAARLDQRGWLAMFRRSGRHTWGWLARTGGTPKTAFALILSL